MVEVYRRFRGIAAFVVRVMELRPNDGAASVTETSANFYQITRRNDSEDSHIHNGRRENHTSSYLSWSPK
jgi:hypothetical protein